MNIFDKAKGISKLCTVSGSENEITAYIFDSFAENSKVKDPLGSVFISDGKKKDKLVISCCDTPGFVTYPSGKYSYLLPTSKSIGFDELKGKKVIAGGTVRKINCPDGASRAEDLTVTRLPIGTPAKLFTPLNETDTEISGRFSSVYSVIAALILSKDLAAYDLSFAAMTQTRAASCKKAAEFNEYRKYIFIVPGALDKVSVIVRNGKLTFSNALSDSVSARFGFKKAVVSSPLLFSEYSADLEEKTVLIALPVKNKDKDNESVSKEDLDIIIKTIREI